HLVVGERLARRRVDQRDAERREIARALRERRDVRILIEHRAAVIAVVGEDEVGAPRAVVQASELHGSADRAAVRVPRVRLGRLIVAELERRCVEDGSAERVVRRALVALLVRAAAAEEEVAAAAARIAGASGTAGAAAPAAAEVAGSASSAGPAATAGPLSVARAEPAAEALASAEPEPALGIGRTELAAADPAQAVLQHPAIDAARVAVDRNRVAGGFGRKARRQQRARRLLGFSRRELGVGGRGGIGRLHLKRLEPVERRLPAASAPAGGSRVRAASAP